MSVLGGEEVLSGQTRTALIEIPRPTWDHLFWGIAAAVAFGVAALHFWALAGAPSGVAPDEASIGVAIRGLLLDGRDEHGVQWPLYFQSFGDWKNPLGIYAMAAVARLTGSTAIETLRATSSGAMLAAAGLFGLLVWRLFRSREIALGAFSVAAVLPWFFAVGRLAFEVAFLPALLMAFLLLWHRADRSRRASNGALAGLVLGLSGYAYSTMRLFMPMLVLSLLLAYAPWRRARAVVACGLTAMAVYLPAVIWSQAHPDALTARYALISVFTIPGPPLEHVWRVYTSAFSLPFLFDEAWFRQGGQLFIGLAPFIALGVLGAWRLRRDPFWRLMILGLVAAPVPAALTYDFGHELRLLEAAPFWLLLAALGAAEGRTMLGPNARRVGALALVLLCIESASFLSDYFHRTPGRTAQWNVAGFDEAVTVAQGEHRRILVSDRISGGDEMFAYAAHEDPRAYRAVGISALGARYGDVKKAVPGEVVIALPTEAVPSAHTIQTITYSAPDEWGHQVAVPTVSVRIRD